MWKMMNWGGKIGMIGGILGGLAGVVAVYAAILASPGEGGRTGPLIFWTIFFLVFFGVFYFVFHKVFGPVSKQNKLQAAGLPAEATILELEETNITVNEIYPVVRLKLEVRPPGGQPYQAEVQTIIGRLDVPQLQPGAVVAVKYDPDDPSNVALANASEADGTGAMSALAAAMSAASAAPGGMQPGGAAPGGLAPAAGVSSPPAGQAQQLEEFLKKNDAEMEEIRRTGTPAPAVIVQAMPLNVFVNGNNPAMTFILDVQPEGKPNFSAQVTGVIGEASAPKYQPGKIVYVKYDPADQSRVSLDHS